MDESKAVRIPQQKRSIDRKEKVVEAAYQLFCDQGYYETSIPEIARHAGVAVGSVYAYFRDKEDLFDEVHRRFTARFDGVREAAVPTTAATTSILADHLRQTVLALVEVHEATKAFNIELRRLAYTNAKVAAASEVQSSKVRSVIRGQLDAYRELVSVEDPDAAALVVADWISALVDRVVFGPCPLPKERVIDEGLRALVGYLGGRADSVP